MNRVNMQIALENAVENARLTVKSKKGLRDAVRVGIYAVGKRVFAVTDAATAYELKDGNLVQLSPEEYTKYIRPEYILQASYEFKGISDQDLITLTKLFEEVGQ
jgi:hypothetical protein